LGQNQMGDPVKEEQFSSLISITDIKSKPKFSKKNKRKNK